MRLVPDRSFWNLTLVGVQEAARLKDLAPPRKKIEAIASSMRLMVHQKLREKAEKAQKEALCHLAAAHSEIEDLKAQLAQRGEECSGLREEVADARLAAVEAATQVQASVAAAVAAADVAADPGTSLDPHLLPPLIKVGPDMFPAVSPSGLPDHLPPVGLPSPTTTWDRPRGRLTREGSSTQAPPLPIARHQSGMVDSQVFDKLMAAFQKEAEASGALKAEVAELGKAVVEGEERLREAGAALEEVKNEGMVAKEKVAAKESQLKELEAKLAVLQDKLAG